MCAKRLAEELNEGFIEDYSTPSKKPRTEQLDTPSKRQKNSYTLEFKLKLVDVYLCTFYFLSQFVKI